jgi:NAD+ diphosphatase
VSKPYVFAGSPIDRLDARRRDSDWIAARLEDPSTRFLALSGLGPAVRDRKLSWTGREALDCQRPGGTPIFLGQHDGVALFAVDVTGTEEAGSKLGAGDIEFPDLRAVAGALPGPDAAIAAQARHLIDWHSRHGFCPGCGQATRSRDAGWARDCPACSTEHFPRTDPVAIMLVHRGDSCLLGRQAAWPGRFFSALAGFVEGGETLEEAVRREVKEEAGITVGEVRYHSSQPWPFPASLMLGCMAEGLTDHIEVDTSELAEAAWFSREDVARALRRPSDVLAVPPAMAIAHQLLRAWLEES